jgi:putative SOS response-associated peptidase YedK
MCGRYTATASPEELQEAFSITRIVPQLTPRWNLAPTQNAPVVFWDQGRHLDLFRWGLIPHWAKEPRIGAKTINARAETLEDLNTFRDSFRRRRCLVPATGFYEWKRNGSAKTPIHIHKLGGGVFAFAGLWDHWQSPEGVLLRTFTIITTAPNALLEPIHDRMPAILAADEYEAWLRPDTDLVEVHRLLKPYPGHDFETVPVSSRVNSVAVDSADLVAPVVAPVQGRLF